MAMEALVAVARVLEVGAVAEGVVAEGAGVAVAVAVDPDLQATVMAVCSAAPAGVGWEYRPPASESRCSSNRQSRRGCGPRSHQRHRQLRRSRSCRARRHYETVV